MDHRNHCKTATPNCAPAASGNSDAISNVIERLEALTSDVAVASMVATNIADRISGPAPSSGASSVADRLEPEDIIGRLTMIADGLSDNVCVLREAQQRARDHLQ